MGDIMKKMNKKSKQRTLAGFALLAVVILVAASVFVYYEYYEEEIEEEIIEEVEIDDRISPLTNQGLICEILRIRHRGLLDKLMARGRSWQELPVFYFILDMDGLEYISKMLSIWEAQSKHRM